MPPQEIPAGVQLMDLISEPPAPSNLRFAFQGLIWPLPDALQSKVDKAAQANPDLLKDTTNWIGRFLKPAWVPPDLRARLRAARAIVSEQDAFLTRFVINDNQIQIVVTRFHVHIAILPRGAVHPMAALHEYLQVDRPDDQAPWTGDPWATTQIAGFTYGYQSRTSVMDWRQSISYLTNGRAVKFSIRKLGEPRPGSGAVKTGFAPTEEAERDWFGKP
jgi:hypothetical protein